MKKVKLCFAALSIIATGMSITVVAAADETVDTSKSNYEVALEPRVGFYTGAKDGSLAVIGFGLAISLRSFQPSGHGIVSSVRASYLGDEPSGGLFTGMVGYGYQADFGGRDEGKVWFDFTPHVGVQAGYLTGYKTGIFGGDVGLDFNIHTRGNAIFGFGASYEPIIDTASGNFAHGVTFGFRVGGGTKASRKFSLS